jgi:hypothetical protein
MKDAFGQIDYVTDPSGQSSRSREKGELPLSERHTSHTIDWYAPGQSRTVEINGLQVTVRFVGRKGRRARIAITAPAQVGVPWRARSTKGRRRTLDST